MPYGTEILYRGTDYESLEVRRNYYHRKQIELGKRFAGQARELQCHWQKVMDFFVLQNLIDALPC